MVYTNSANGLTRAARPLAERAPELLMLARARPLVERGRAQNLCGRRAARRKQLLPEDELSVRE